MRPPPQQWRRQQRAHARLTPPPSPQLTDSVHSKYVAKKFKENMGSMRAALSGMRADAREKRRVAQAAERSRTLRRSPPASARAAEPRRAAADPSPVRAADPSPVRAAAATLRGSPRQSAAAAHETRAAGGVVPPHSRRMARLQRL